MSESYLFGQFVNCALHYKSQGAITHNTSLKHFKKHKNNSAIKSDFHDRGSALMRLSAGCGGWGGGSVLPLDQGPASGHTREEPAVSRGGHGALRPCSRLQSLFPPRAGVGRCPSPGHTRVSGRSRVMSLSVQVLFKVSTMRSSTPVRPHAPCLRQSSQKNQYHYGSQCTTQLCPQIKTPSVSGTLLSRVWDSLGCVDALRVRHPQG